MIKMCVNFHPPHPPNLPWKMMKQICYVVQFSLREK